MERGSVFSPKIFKILLKNEIVAKSHGVYHPFGIIYLE
jgi:hypothetical protein